MHIVIVLGLLIALVLWFYWVTDPRPESGAGPGTPLAARLPSGLALTFIAAGKLFYKDDAGAVRSRTFQGAAASQVTSTLLMPDGSALCFLRGERLGRLLSCDFETGRETDILQRPYLDLTDLSLDERGERILCTSAAADGTSNIASLTVDGSSFRELTAGDTLDAAPTRVPGDAGTLLFQSCGVARNSQGDIVAHGNISIQKLNLRSRSVDAVLESPSYDFLAPRVCAQGKLYFIRRPYEGSHFSTGNLFLDTLLFPLQLLRATVRHVTTLPPVVGHKTLAGAAGHAFRADAGNVMLKGRRIDTERARHEMAAVHGIISLVPASWELVVRSELGAEQVLATNVASFDLMENGNIVYANGCAVFLLERTQSTLLLSDQLVVDVSAAWTAPAMGASAN